MTNEKTSKNDSDGIRSLALAVVASAGAAMIILHLGGCATSGAASMGATTGTSEASVAAMETAPEEQATDAKAWSSPAFRDGWYDDIETEPTPEVSAVEFDDQANASGSGMPFAATGDVSAMKESMFAPLNMYRNMPSSSKSLGNVAQVSFTDVGSDFDADIDSTGSFLVYASTQHNHNADIYRKNIDGRTTTQLTDDSGHDLMPEISPDCSKIAFTSDRNGNWDVFVMPIDGGPAVQITYDDENELHPTWSPDGKSMAYCRFNDRTMQWEIWTVDFDRPSARSFVCEGMFPRWSNDTSVDRLLFQRARKRGEQLYGIWTIEIRNGSGFNPTEILSAEASAIMHPTWSPDGKRIAFTAVLEPEVTVDEMPVSAEIWTVDLDGTTRTVLTSDGFRNMRPSWGSNGRVFFTSNRDGIDNIWSVSDGTLAYGSPEMAVVGEAMDDQSN